MRTTKIMLGMALAAICATPIAAEPKSPKLARCDGKIRRPANPYGTILPTVDPAAGTVTPVAPSGIDVFPPAAPVERQDKAGAPLSGSAVPTEVPPIGAIAPSNYHRSC